jgi:hypothetical protein
VAVVQTSGSRGSVTDEPSSSSPIRPAVNGSVNAVRKTLRF